METTDEIYEEHINQAKVAEELGYDTVWLTEHHFWEDGWCPALIHCSSDRCQNNNYMIGTRNIASLGKHPINVVEEATVAYYIKADWNLCWLRYRVQEFEGYEYQEVIGQAHGRRA